MSVYNGQKFLGESIESILRQTWTDFEFLIINDGSTDRTEEIIVSYKDPRIRLLNNPCNIGLTKSLNRGLVLARGEFIARQDADDVSHPNRLETEIRFLQSDPDIALVGTQVRIIDEHGSVSYSPEWERALTEGAIRFQLMFDSAFIHTSVLFRRDIIWNQLGGYDESLPAAEDFDLWSRVAAKYPVRNLPEALIDFRFHSESSAAQWQSDHLRFSSPVVTANLRNYLQLEHVPVDWPLLISSLHINHAPAGTFKLGQLTSAAMEILERFIELHPDEKDNQEIIRVLAKKIGQIACRLAGSGPRRDAVRAYQRVHSLDREAAKSIATKFLVLLLFGERAYVHLRRLTRFTQRAPFSAKSKIETRA